MGLAGGGHHLFGPEGVAVHYQGLHHLGQSFPPLAVQDRLFFRSQPHTIILPCLGHDAPGL